MRHLVYSQAKINESLQKKLAAIDKFMETIYAKMDGFSIAMKNQLSFNKALETQLAQLAADAPAAKLGKISGKSHLAGHPSAMLKSSHAQEEEREVS